MYIIKTRQVDSERYANEPEMYAILYDDAVGRLSLSDYRSKQYAHASCNLMRDWGHHTYIGDDEYAYFQKGMTK